MARTATLQDELDEITSRTRTLVQPERLAVSERSVEDLSLSGAENRIVPVGTRAPEFGLPDFSSNIVRSADLLALGHLIVCFFRGRWCPYCCTELAAWRDLHSEVRSRGAFLIAISPQTVRQNDFTASQHNLGFPILSDAGCKVATAFGLAYSVLAPMQQHYRSILVNLPLMNGDNSWQLPLPGTFVIGQNGVILFAEAHADFRVRPEPRQALEALNS